MPKLVTLVTVMSIVFSIATFFTALAVRARTDPCQRRPPLTPPRRAQFAVVVCMRHCDCGIGEPGRVALKRRPGSRISGAASHVRNRAKAKKATVTTSGVGSGT